MIKKLKLFIKTTRFATTIWYSSLFLLLEILIGIIIYYYMYSSLTRQLDSSLNRQAEAIYNLVSDSKIDISDFKPDSVYSSPQDVIFDLIYEALVFNPRNYLIQIELNNKIIYSTDNLKGLNINFPAGYNIDRGIVRFRNEELSKHSIREAFYKKGKYDIFVAFPADLISETLSSLIDIYILLAPVFFIISIAGGFVISSRSLSRIDSIIKKTNEITAQNLNEKIKGEEFQDEYGRLVRTMNAMINRIKTSYEYINQFTISASHELKTPLTILRGEIEIALKSGKSITEYKQVLESNYEETLRLINIVDKLFLISRIDQSLIFLKRENVSLLEFLEETIINLASLGKKYNIKLSLDMNEDVNLNIDTGLMREAISNLVDNAVKYGNENSIVIIKVELYDSLVKIEIINKGPGIPKEALPYIFDRFYRVESSHNRNTGGAGLGLSIVKSIVNWHEGKVEVESEPYKETRFTILLNQS